ncbi:CUE1 [[Candida] subhashii]|uniref:Coupling of ubiquitin conjugation to ER degradation protein 1 n=1 Tax=[Candida] subhashii TaxID=561895 RepID=A0A8J5QWW1_9ASCO|nr:CUE1 [[Candida] subhashii]KAG7663730.1 CUE1 [[Candida] subhashii]
MEHSTILFIAALGVAFIFLRWLISPIPQTNDFNINIDESSSSSTATTSGRNTNTSRTTQRRRRRDVTDSMIEVVQTIAPSLTVEQIRYDLENTGSVEVTINRFMELGSLPFPPGYTPPPTNPTASSSGSSSKSGIPTKKSVNLLEKYNIDLDSTDNGEGKTLLQKRREEMIIGARKRLESQLRNEI